MRSTQFRSPNIDSSVCWQTIASSQMASEHYPMNELQQVQLRAQILVYGALLEGSLPEEALMIGSFSDTTEGLQESSWDDGRLLWEKAWVTALQRAQGMPSATCQEGTRAKLDTLRPSFPNTSALIESMPTATRTSLSALHPISNIQEAQEESAAGFSSKNARARRSGLLEKSRKRKKIHFFQTEPGGETMHMHELDMEQAKVYVQNAESVAASILEHSESLHELLQGETSDTQQAEVASAAIAMGAAASAAKASAAAAKFAYEAALQAKRIADSTIQSFNHASGPRKRFLSNHQFKEQGHEGFAYTLELVLRAVSQAQTAMATGTNLVGGSRERKRRMSERNRRLTEVEVEVDALQEKQLAEGVSVEVMSRKSGFGGAWFTAKVLDVKDGIVYVLYDERFDDNDDYLKEWLPIKGSEFEPVQAPRIRFPHPIGYSNERDKKTTMFWMVGDHVDVCIGHGWREGIITSVSSEDCNNMTVFFPGEGNTMNAKSSDLRPSLLWQDNGWVLWQNLQMKCAQLEEDAASDAEMNSGMITENVQTGPPTSHKMRNLIDLITTECGKPQTIKKRDEKSKVSQVERSKRRKSLTNGTSNGHGKRSIKGSNSKVASKVRKAKELIEKASKPFNLQVSGSRLTRQFIKKLVSASASGDASKVMLARGHHMLRELVRLKASSRKLPTHPAGTADASQQRPRRLIQPTSKLLEGLQSALEGGKTALLF